MAHATQLRQEMDAKAAATAAAAAGAVVPQQQANGLA